MPDYAINGSTLTGIADAIRSKTGKSEKITPEQMPAEIQSITGGGEPEPPDDGKTRLYITIPPNAVEGLPPPRSDISIAISSGLAEIDFGDGTDVVETSGGNNIKNHTYKVAGDYVITISRINDSKVDLGYSQKAMCLVGSTSDNNRVYRCMLKKAVIAEGFRMTNYTLYSCHSISSVILPKDTVSIPFYAFNLCYAMSSIVIPASVETISNNAFQSTGIKEFHLLPEQPPTIETSTFYGVPNDCVYYVPVGSLETYKAATNWSAIAAQIQEEPA